MKRSRHRTHRTQPDHSSLRAVVGVHAVREVLRVRPESIADLWIRQDATSEPLQIIMREAQRCKVSWASKSNSQLDKVAPSSQGVAVWVKDGPEFDWDSVAREARVHLVVLDGIEDPHNLGAILRSAWLMGIKGILIPQDRAVGLTATVAKVASGGAEHVPIEYFTSLAVPAERLKAMGFWFYGLAADARQGLWNLKLPEKIVWVIGSEDHGIRVATRKICDELVYIPQVDSSSSYNASVAAALAFAESARTRLTLDHHK